MFALNPINFLLYLQSFSAEIVSIISLCCCYLSIITLACFFKKEGLLVYNVIALIACNMQVLKATNFVGYHEPVALGTVVYASSFLVSDLLTEIYSVHYAKKTIAVSFVSSVILLLMMLIAISFPEITSTLAKDYHFKKCHEALTVIFTPNVAILSASLIAFLISQLIDIYIFSKLKEKIKSQLWQRTLISFFIAAFIDSIIFNTLAWKIFSIYEISWHSLIFSYILGSYVMQITVALFNIPAMYVLSKFIKRSL